MTGETVPPRRRSQRWYVFAGAAVVYTYFAVAGIVGAGTSMGVGVVATVVATALYVLSALIWSALVAVAVSLSRRSRRPGELSVRSLQTIVAMPPLGGTTLLAAAYVARMNGQPFLGGFEAMVVTTVSLVVLLQVFPALERDRRAGATGTTPSRD